MDHIAVEDEAFYQHDEEILFWGAREYCPCPLEDVITYHRQLQSENGTNTTTNPNSTTVPTTEPIKTWEVVYTCIVLLFMFVALVSDRIGADHVMLITLSLFMASQIISIEEGLAGFANDGLVSVLVLFVIAEGISKTGALDWYMGKLLGRPKTAVSAQTRLMVPIAIVSAFLNNTPVVSVMIPIVQRWGKTVGVSAQQLLIPLSFASILGGTCTLIGTSTNLVVKGLMDDRYPDGTYEIGLFDLGAYGVPVAFAGMTYILLASPCLLPGGRRTSDGSGPLDSKDDLLLGARLTQWSPAAGRSVKRSGLRDTGGIYLVSVHRYTTGNVHRAVGQDFVLNMGDILYFTGLVEEFGEFCEEHGLEVITNEIESNLLPSQLDPNSAATSEKPTEGEEVDNHDNSKEVEEAPAELAVANGSEDLPPPGRIKASSGPLATLYEDSDVIIEEGIPYEVGVTKESLLQADDAERLRSITRMTDTIRGHERDESDDLPSGSSKKKMRQSGLHASVLSPGADSPKVVVTIDHDLVVIGVNARDRAGLLLDISKGLLRLNLQLHHTEAAVRGERSLSIWRCEPIGTEIPDLEEVWSVLTALLGAQGIEAVKKRGLRVIRAKVTPVSRILGRTAADFNFRETYHAAIIAIRKGGRHINRDLSTVIFDPGDVLILQASDDSPLLKLKPPTDNYYKKLAEEAVSVAATGSGGPVSVLNLTTFRRSFTDLAGLNRRNSHSDLSASSDLNHQSNNFSQLLASDQQRAPEPPQDVMAAVGADYFVEPLENGTQAADGNLEMVVPPSGIEMEHLENADGEAVLRDLEVLVFGDKDSGNSPVEREFLTAMAVAKNSNLVGRTAKQEDIDKLPGVVLVSIERPVASNSQTDHPTSDDQRKSKNASSRNRSYISSGASGGAGSDMDGMDGSLRTNEPIYTSIPPEEPLNAGDILWFAGSAQAVGDLRKIPGLISHESGEVEKMNEAVFDRRLVQAVVARQGPLVGKTVKEARFRTRYGAAVIAVHREGKRILDHPGKIKLQAGDVLLLEAGSTFIGKRVENERSFALLSEVKDSAPPRLGQLIPALVITFVMLLVYTAGWVKLLISSLFASFLMVAMGILSEQEARDAVNWEVYVTIAAAFGIGTALVNSGVAGAVAGFLVDVGEAVGIGDAGLYAAVYLATFLVSNIVTNNAAATLLFPIALNTAETAGADPLLMSYCLMLAASASFMSPFGYTTNLLIYGPGGYKYNDFLAIGTPMQIVLWVLSVYFLSTTEIWWVHWISTAAVFLVVVAARVCAGGEFFSYCGKSSQGKDKEDS